MRLLGSRGRIRWRAENGSTVIETAADAAAGGQPAYVFEIAR